jgi:hypothetical protein
MTASHITTSSIAGEAYDWFTRQERGDETITVLKDGAPEWLTDLVYEAHGEFLPDDWRYQTIRNALGHIHDNSLDSEDEMQDSAHEFADGNVDTYNHARAQWLASNLNRAGYVDEAVEEFGHHEYGIYGDIGLGQYRESEEIYQGVCESLQARLEELEDEAQDDDES